MSHPGVAEAAAVAVPHPRWGERPLLVVVRHPGATVDEVELLRCIEGKVPRWWLPDSVVFAESLPRTATGKVMKAKLREEHASINADASMVETASRAGKSDVGDQTPAEYR